jgi:hypothetical protein
MDWNSNTLLFLNICKTNKYCNNCRYNLIKECTCNQIYFRHNNNYSTYVSSFREFKKVVDKYFEGGNTIDNTCLNTFKIGCNCSLCKSGTNLCDSTIKYIYEQKINKKKEKDCDKCKYGKLYTGNCNCDEKSIYTISIISIPEQPINTKPTDSVFTITFFEINRKEYFDNNFNGENIFSITEWLFENKNYLIQFSIYSTLNVYDDTLRLSVKKYNEYLIKSSIKLYNKKFSGLKSLSSYIAQFDLLIKYYNDDKTLEKIEAKENPHMVRKKRVPKINR